MFLFVHAGTLHTKRLELQPLSTMDTEALAVLMSNPGIGQFWFRSRVPDHTDIAALLQRSQALRKTSGTGLWGLRRDTDEELAGIAWLWPADDSDIHEFGLALASRHRGQGYALEAGAVILAHARHHLRWSRLQASAEVGSSPATRALTRLGFHEAGIVSRPMGVRRIFHRDLRANAARRAAVPVGTGSHPLHFCDEPYRSNS